MKKRIYNILLLLADCLLINVSFVLGFLLRFDNDFLYGVKANAYFGIYLKNIFIFTFIKIVVFYFLGMYKSLWKYASTEEIVQVINTSLIANICILIYSYLTKQKLPISIYCLIFILDIILLGGIRFSYRALRRIKNNYLNLKKNLKRTMIIGAGESALIVIKELKNHSELNSEPVAVIDDDNRKLHRKINGVPVLGDRNNIKGIAEKEKIDEIIIAIPSASKNELRNILEICSKTKCKLRMLPGIYELLDGKVSIKKIRNVDIEDLLGRECIKVDLRKISNYIQERTVLVTGGGGSIGSELCRQVAKFNPKELIILDIYENNAYEIQNELTRNFPNLKLIVLIGSIRDEKRMEEIFLSYKPEVVFHAAAHKHVPLMEENPKEAVKNNVFGTLNLVKCADKYNVKKFVLISTDKAVNPTNVMGATKRITEMIMQCMSKRSKTEFVAVRFGNVLGSNGSVIPLFKKQIEKGGPVTVTHKEVTRFFMTIQEAVQLVIQAGAMAKGGEIFVLDMGQPVKIVNLAENLIRLSGFEPYIDIKIKFIGLRPGEKLYEELLMKEEGLKKTNHNKIFIGKPLFMDYEELMGKLNKLRIVIRENSGDVKEYLEKIVTTYTRMK